MRLLWVSVGILVGGLSLYAGSSNSGKASFGKRQSAVAGRHVLVAHSAEQEVRDLRTLTLFGKIGVLSISSDR